MCADCWFWILKPLSFPHTTHGIEGVGLPIVTTPFMAKVVKDEVIIPVYETIEEHIAQAALGLTYNILREYKVKEN